MRRLPGVPSAVRVNEVMQSSSAEPWRPSRKLPRVRGFGVEGFRATLNPKEIRGFGFSERLDVHRTLRGPALHHAFGTENYYRGLSNLAIKIWFL